MHEFKVEHHLLRITHLHTDTICFSQIQIALSSEVNELSSYKLAAHALRLINNYAEIFHDKTKVLYAQICSANIRSNYSYLYYAKKEMKGTARGCTDHTPLSVPLIPPIHPRVYGKTKNVRRHWPHDKNAQSLAPRDPKFESYRKNCGSL